MAVLVKRSTAAVVAIAKSALPTAELAETYLPATDIITAEVVIVKFITLYKVIKFTVVSLCLLLFLLL